MTMGAFILVYGLMLAFDLAVLAGAAFLIAERGGSGWWMALAVLMCAGSNPKYLINAWNNA